MDIQVYSLPRGEMVPLTDVQAVLNDRTVTPEQFYENCVRMFPVVLEPMTPEEIDAQRNLDGWRQKGLTATFTHRITPKLDAYAEGMEFPGLRQRFPASALPRETKDIPLLGVWHKWGQRLYGTPDFDFGLNETLRRDAAPIDRVIGDHIHSDSSLDDGYDDRNLSFFSLCADSIIETPADHQSAWWATQWHDMRKLSYEPAGQYESTSSISPAFSQAQMRIERDCPGRGLPANHHIVMPPWMLHKASGFMDAPFDYDTRFPADRPQPQAYISHALFYGPKNTP